ncbi:MAG TPA: sugar ABC transporter permease [Candidatus Aerophobetes bacterium]|uniref:Sugar ABC transporter permease n=1 Tax=Aerophobetes bacterium TaxID=2030807 RepID=A0A7V0QRN3_UNCAE|nr:sugar ABC transporter permease [Candidatus Aerophobetes bacterium]
MKSRKARLLDYLTSVLFLLPNFLGFLLFTLGPTIASLILSFTDWDLLTPPKWVGLANFIKLLGFHRTAEGWRPNDPYFWYYLWNTIFYMLFIPISMGLSLLMALLFNRKVKGVVVFRTIYFLPSVCSGVAIAILWRWLYNPDFGLINYLLSKIGIKGPNWLASTKWAKPAIALMGLWAGLGGYNTVLYLAALQNVPRDLYEAAQVDGANPWQRFRYVTWPSLSPTTFFIFIMSVIGGFQGGFMQAYLMTQGGPAGSTTTLSYYIYDNAYRWYHMGYASAIAWVLFILVFIVTLINWKYGERIVAYI